MRPNLKNSDFADLGASLVEYALLVAFIAVVCVFAIRQLGGTVSTRISGATESMFVTD